MKTKNALLMVLVAALSGACATTRAATPVERPALEVPPPPPRVIVPLPAPEAPAIEPVGDVPPNSAAPKPRPPRATSEPAKPETKPEVTPPVEATPPATPPPQQPQLRIPETANSAQQSAQIKEMVDRANWILSKIDYGPLSDARKKAYRDAQLFAKQAEDALKASNLVFAKELAEKAERLAKELQGR